MENRNIKHCYSSNEEKCFSTLIDASVCVAWRAQYCSSDSLLRLQWCILHCQSRYAGKLQADAYSSIV